MAPSFADQIKGIPLELVRQGWRREPTRGIELAWDDQRITNPDRLQKWSTQFIRVDGASIEIWRPEVSGKYSDSIALYAHEGWADGLSPTVETVEVWKYWWALEDGETIPVSVVSNKGELFARNWQDIMERILTQWKTMIHVRVSARHLGMNWISGLDRSAIQG